VAEECEKWRIRGTKKVRGKTFRAEKSGTTRGERDHVKIKPPNRPVKGQQRGGRKRSMKKENPKKAERKKGGVGGDKKKPVEVFRKSVKKKKQKKAKKEKCPESPWAEI